MTLFQDLWSIYFVWMLQAVVLLVKIGQTPINVVLYRLCKSKKFDVALHVEPVPMQNG